MEELPYLTMVLKEAMRLYPSAPVIGRRSVADTEVDGVRIPAGADILVSPWVTQRHPERFDPSRFTPEAEAGRPGYAWFPFGGGPRACIGQHLSMLESVRGAPRGSAVGGAARVVCCLQRRCGWSRPRGGAAY